MAASTTPVGGMLWPSLRVLQIWGANTDVGKTVLSTVLCVSALHRRPKEGVHYLKPVSTGPQDDSDSKTVRRWCSKFLHGSTMKSEWFDTHTTIQYDDPVSPHIAATNSQHGIISDQNLLAAIHFHASKHAAGLRPRHAPRSWLFCETAGGVHSPGPSGTSQADLYRPLRLPAILVGDHKLGGISATISAYESLRLRGYDVESVLLLRNEQYRNHEYLTSYFQEQEILCTAVTPPPERDDDPRKDLNMMHQYYNSTARSNPIKDLLRRLDKNHDMRIANLHSMAESARQRIWYPFTQQKLLTTDKITAIDSAHGDYFQTFFATPELPKDLERKLPGEPGYETRKRHQQFDWEAKSRPCLHPSFDGSASWWTQGLGHANPRLTLAAAYAAGRYGHVMFAEAIHEPALHLAKLLLRQLGNPRLSRVFYSDNGSTGTEVAVKMALRAARLRYGWGPREELRILGLKSSYHGDTIGAMDCSEPGTYNEKIEWYKGKGYWFDFPTVNMTNGQWKINVPAEFSAEVSSAVQTEFSELGAIFDLEARAETELYQDYTRYITRTLEGLRDQGYKFGALMLEPVVLGAGGMMLADPLFQQALVDVVRSDPKLFSESSLEPHYKDDKTWKGLPVVFDEVFTGLYRLGNPSSAKLLGVHPDITVHAKLLTGGLVPLAVTAASNSIFRSFESDDKSDALLHGHSYTAHPVGCQVAIESLQTMMRMEKRGAWRRFQQDWADDTLAPLLGQNNGKKTPAVWSVWSREFVKELSTRADHVEGVWALGSVLAIHLKDASGSGYTSNASRALQAELMKGPMDVKVTKWYSTVPSNVHTRVLGNVFYLMTSQTTSFDIVKDLEKRMLRAAALGAVQEEEEVETETGPAAIPVWEYDVEDENTV
ncbi:adenosylmethionine-8-amino-7-oxononanoate aminotransferase [Diaporthe helianthi]|uniref:Adenosylmethionine-8-amino-7-oxononanoate aminotransferase n=1 Tax=Diaporthe helianthi TaxID=158607 RepID=A0A2P5HI44_DIAHE|nr:adenosylmethionine-8-amino-7-oxononanoate aminotransferase [Diaporthe helianthi]